MELARMGDIYKLSNFIIMWNYFFVTDEKYPCWYAETDRTPLNTVIRVQAGETKPNLGTGVWPLAPYQYKGYENAPATHWVQEDGYERYERPRPEPAPAPTFQELMEQNGFKPATAPANCIVVSGHVESYAHLLPEGWEWIYIPRVGFSPAPPPLPQHSYTPQRPVLVRVDAKQVVDVWEKQEQKERAVFQANMWLFDPYSHGGEKWHTETWDREVYITCEGTCYKMPRPDFSNHKTDHTVFARNHIRDFFKELKR